MNNEELQQLVIESLGAGSWFYDLQHNTVSCSDECLALAGYERGYRVIEPDWIRDNAHPEDLPIWWEAFVKCAKGQSPAIDCELRFKHKQDHYIWIQAHGKVIKRDSNGRALQAAGIVFDISHRGTAKQSESRYRLFLDSIPDAISLKDRDGKYLYVNRQFEAWLGKSAHQVYGKRADEVYPPNNDFSVLRDHEAEVWKSEQTISEERNFARTADGVTRRAVITKYPIFDEFGRMLAMGSTSTDVSERSKAQEAIRLSEKRFRRLFESAPVSLAECDFSKGQQLIKRLQQQGVANLRQHLVETPDLLQRRSEVMDIIDLNREALRIYGAENPAQLKQHLDHELNDEQRLPIIEDLIAFSQGEHRSTVHTRAQRLSGRLFPIIHKSELNSASTEDWSQVLMLTRDVSAEEAVRQSEIRYRRLFESAPAALYESDWSRGKALVEKLRAEGVTDIGHFLRRDQSLLIRRDEVLQIIDCNGEAQHIFRASSKSEFMAMTEGKMTERQRDSLISVLEAFAAGKRRSSVHSISQRIDGEDFPIVRDAELISADRADWSRVLISIHDLTTEVENANRLRAYQEELRSLAGKISLAEESERRRISSELHDGTIQNLVLARIHIATLQNSLESQPALDLAEKINRLLEVSLTETRSLIFEISPPVLYELGLEAAVEWLAEHYKDHSGLPIKISKDKHSIRLSEEMNIVIFQAVRELLVNIVKHAKADSVSIEWRDLGSQLLISVTDDGVGFDASGSDDKPATEGGFGLFALRERLKLLGVGFEIHSSSKGTEVKIAAPVNPQEQ